MSADTLSHDLKYKACPADGVRTEFGVCQGDPIHQIQDLVLGDTFLTKHQAMWSDVTPEGPNLQSFTRDIAANVPQQRLHVIAELIFMTTTGRRMDVYATVVDGQLHFVSETEFQPNVGHVLIDIAHREHRYLPTALPRNVSYHPQTAPQAMAASQLPLQA